MFCCPDYNMVCCPVGCCPKGYGCDENGECTKAVQQVSLVAIEGMVNDICPDGISECPNGSTCCKLSSGQYGCCPLENAVCCSDGIHCCPKGYTCDPSGTCTESNNQQISLVVLGDMLTNVICPDGISECPDKTTCCRLSTGQWGCCPIPKVSQSRYS